MGSQSGVVLSGHPFKLSALSRICRKLFLATLPFGKAHQRPKGKPVESTCVVVGMSAVTRFCRCCTKVPSLSAAGPRLPHGLAAHHWEGVIVQECIARGAAFKIFKRAPTGWKRRRADELYRPACWAKRYVLRAISIPVGAPLDGTGRICVSPAPGSRGPGFPGGRFRPIVQRFHSATENGSATTLFIRTRGSQYAGFALS